MNDDKRIDKIREIIEGTWWFENDQWGKRIEKRDLLVKQLHTELKRSNIEGRVEELEEAKKKMKVKDGYSPGMLYSAGVESTAKACRDILDERITTLKQDLAKIDNKGE